MVSLFKLSSLQCRAILPNLPRFGPRNATNLVANFGFWIKPSRKRTPSTPQISTSSHRTRPQSGPLSTCVSGGGSQRHRARGISDLSRWIRRDGGCQPSLRTATYTPFTSWRSPRSYSTRSVEGPMADNKYAADYARMGTSSCKKCKQKLEKGSFRIAKVVNNPFSEDGGDMKQYHHPRCIFDTFVRARPSTKIIEDAEDLQGFDNLEDDDKKLVLDLIAEIRDKRGSPKKTPAKKKSPAAAATAAAAAASPSSSTLTKAAPLTSPEKTASDSSAGSSVDPVAQEKDNSFRQFRVICAELAEENSYTGKTAIIANFITKGSSGVRYYGDVYLLLKLLLPGVVKTIYNLNSKQLVKIFAKIFGVSETAMVEDLEQGDVAETVRLFFEQSKICPPSKKSTLTIQTVDKALDELSKYTKEDDQQTVLAMIAKRCTGNDLKMVVRLIKHDLRINAGAKHVLDALDPNAYQAFQASRDLRDVVDRVSKLQTNKPGMGSKKLSIKASLMTPILPMLAEACKSVEYAFKKCPNGMYAEIKYDGERVQVHKQGDDFSYFSRSLKPVLPHKVAHFKEYIPKAFKHGNDLILDAEVLLIDTNTGNPLPFGTLGVHKKAAFKDANVCLFIFDCIHYNGENLMDRPIKQRRKFLRENMTEIPNRIMFSEMKHITEPADLKEMIMRVLRDGLEGLVLKDVNSIYEPGKRHWLKVKKDYLAEGAMADTADLVVLGAYFGTGNKGGIMSIFLMGVLNPKTGVWCTVTKCHSGFDDKTLAALQKEFDMVKISKAVCRVHSGLDDYTLEELHGDLLARCDKIAKDHSKVPSWLNVSRQLTPDFVVKDPKESQVWEITGAEFTKAEAHTADGISIRFPRCTKMRIDKTWKEATSLPELKALYTASKQHSDLPDLLGGPSSKKAPTSSSSASSSSLENGKALSENGETGQRSSKKRSSTNTDGPPPSKKKQTEQSTPTTKPSNEHLPNVFTGMRFFIPTDVDSYEKLRRYIIAFDGDIVADYEKESATHIIVWNGPMPPSSNRHVTTEWVWKCIKKKRVMPVKGRS